jgi:hypothetical protein
VAGSKDEIAKIYSDYKDKKPPPPVLVQSISNVVFVESVIIFQNIEYSSANTAAADSTGKRGGEKSLPV